MTRRAETPDAEQWLTSQDACALLGVSPATLRRWSVAGLVPTFTTPGGHRRFARSAIVAMLPRRSAPGAASDDAARALARELLCSLLGTGLGAQAALGRGCALLRAELPKAIANGR